MFNWTGLNWYSFGKGIIDIQLGNVVWFPIRKGYKWKVYVSSMLLTLGPSTVYRIYPMFSDRKVLTNSVDPD